MFRNESSNDNWFKCLNMCIYCLLLVCVTHYIFQALFPVLCEFKAVHLSISLQVVLKGTLLSLTYVSLLLHGYWINICDLFSLKSRDTSAVLYISKMRSLKLVYWPFARRLRFWIVCFVNKFKASFIFTIVLKSIKCILRKSSSAVVPSILSVSFISNSA